jgi:hypothetical protein
MPDAGPSVEVAGRNREYPLPAPLAVGIWVLSGQGVRLALSDGDFPRAEVEVLDAQPEAFEESQPRTVQERAYQARGAVQLGQDCLDLVAGQRDSFDAVQRLFQHMTS